MKNVKIKVDGLTCANCGAKIEGDAKAMFGDENVFLNLMKQEMDIKSLEDNSTVLSSIRNIVNKYEPDVNVYELKNDEPFVIVMKGLDCSHCASKIEDMSSKLPDVSNANLNFMSKEMKVTLSEGASKIKVYNEIKDIVKKLEPDVNVEIKGSETCKSSCCEHSEEEKKDSFINKILSIKVRFTAGIILFLVASVLGKENLISVPFSSK